MNDIRFFWRILITSSGERSSFCSIMLHQTVKTTERRLEETATGRNCISQLYRWRNNQANNTTWSYQRDGLKYQLALRKDHCANTQGHVFNTALRLRYVPISMSWQFRLKLSKGNMKANRPISLLPIISKAAITTL